MFESANCLGFVLERNEWIKLDCFTVAVYDELYQAVFNKNPNEAVAIQKLKVDELLAELVAAEFCKKFGFEQIQTTSAEAPIGAIVMKVGSFGIFTDFHFAVKGKFDGETVWFHKPGNKAIDFMFDPDMEFDEKYRTKPRYFKKVDAPTARQRQRSE